VRTLFVGTILGQSYRPVIAEINAVAEKDRDWPLVLSKYNAESARRKARPLTRSTAPRGGAILATSGQPRITREAAERGRKERRIDMSKVECYECHKSGHYARDCRSKEKGGSDRQGGVRGGKGHHRGRRGSMRNTDTWTSRESMKEEGRISLSRPLFDEHESWVGLTTGVESSKPQMEIVDDGNELEPIQWPDEEVIESNAWTDSTLFTEDSILIAGEPVEPMWVVDSGATHHVTARRELLRDVRKLEVPKTFGLADKTASMKANEVGSMKIRLRSGRLVTLKEVYYVPASRVSLLSLSSLLKHGWTVDMRDGGGTIKRGTERLTLRKDGPLWTTVLGTVEPLALAVGIGSEGKSILEQEHQRLGHIGRSRLLDLAKAGKLNGSFEDLRKDSFRTRPVRSMSPSQDRAIPQEWRSAAIARWCKWHWTRYRPCGTIGRVGGWPPIPVCRGRAVERHCIRCADWIKGGGDACGKGSTHQARATAWGQGAGDQVLQRHRVCYGEAIEWYRTTGIQHYTSP
jgi:hypothetical protein